MDEPSEQVRNLIVISHESFFPTLFCLGLLLFIEYLANLLRIPTTGTFTWSMWTTASHITTSNWCSPLLSPTTICPKVTPTICLSLSPQSFLSISRAEATSLSRLSHSLKLYKQLHFLIGKVLKMRIIVYLCMVFHTLWGHFNYN